MKGIRKATSGKQPKSTPSAGIVVDALEFAGQDDAVPLAAAPSTSNGARRGKGMAPSASEEWLVEFLHSAAVGVAVLTPDARFVQVNEAFCHIVGYPRDELVRGFDCAALTHPDDLPAMTERIEALVAGRIPNFVLENRYRRKDGTLVWVRNSVSLTRNDDGQPRHLIALCEDITERKRAEQISAHLAAIVTSAEEAIASKALDGTVTSWNASAERMFGYTAEEMIGQSILRLIPADRHEEEDLILARIRSGQRIEHFETVRVTKDGRPIEVSLTISPIHDSAGTIIGASKIVRDITERKRANEQLRASEAALHASEAQLAADLADMTRLQRISGQLIQEGDLDALFEQIVTAAIALMHSDMASLQMLDSERNRLRLLAWKGFNPAAAAFWEWISVESSTSCGQAYLLGERVIVADAETCEFMAGTKDLDFYHQSGIRSVQSTPLVARNGRFVGMISTHWRVVHEPSERELHLLDLLARQAADLIERTQAEDALRASERALIAANQRKDEFLGIASHELRTPLTSAKANVQIAARRLASALEAPAADSGATLVRLRPLLQLLERSESALDRLNRLVVDLLDDSRIQGGKLKLRLRRVDLVALVRAAVDEARPAWPGREIRLEGALTGQGAGKSDSLNGTVLADVDSDRVHEVVSNYLSNALKYAPPDHPIAVRLEAREGVARVAVRDHGPGLSAEQQGRLFERFYRVEGILHQQGSTLGLGLGLYICKTIIERHGGQVGVISKPGDGSTFWFALPLSAAATADDGERVAADEGFAS